MTNNANLFLSALVISSALVGCGLNVPAKDPLRSDTPDPEKPYHTKQGEYENTIVSHVVCEIANGLAAAQKSFALPWLDRWGTAVTLTITAQDQGGISPGVSLINPLQNAVTVFPVGGNVVSPQSFTLGMGMSGSANATRTETIQFTYLNSDLLEYAQNFSSCAAYQHGMMIDGDLKIRQFIYDKALIARFGNASLYSGKPPVKPALTWQWPVYNTFTEEILFVATFGGSITPTWKLARIAANSSANFLAAQRTYTNDLIITLGPVGTVPSPQAPAALSTSAQNQHNARVQGSAIATSIGAQPR